MTRTARSLAHLRKMGYLPDVVERYNSYTRKKKDFLGLFDILAIHDKAPGVLGVQVTAGGGDVAAHIRKYRTDPELSKHLKAWIDAGNEAVIHSWALRGAKGKRKLWEVKEVYLSL